MDFKAEIPFDILYGHNTLLMHYTGSSKCFYSLAACLFRIVESPLQSTPPGFNF